MSSRMSLFFRNHLIHARPLWFGIVFPIASVQGYPFSRGEVKDYTAHTLQFGSRKETNKEQCQTKDGQINRSLPGPKSYSISLVFCMAARGAGSTDPHPQRSGVRSAPMPIGRKRAGNLGPIPIGGLGGRGGNPVIIYDGPPLLPPPSPKRWGDPPHTFESVSGHGA